jgi:hypothetical protein
MLDSSPAGSFVAPASNSAAASQRNKILSLWWISSARNIHSKDSEKLTTQDVEGGQQALMQVFLPRLSFQATRFSKLLGLGRFGFEPGNLVDQPINLGLQLGFLCRKIV